MRPIRTERSNFTYLGPRPNIADLPCRREGGHVFAVFKLTDQEREAIAKGANIELGIYTEPIPPVSMSLVNEPEAPGQRSGSHMEPDFRCERCRALYVASRAVELDFDCGQCGGKLSLPPAFTHDYPVPPPGPPDPARPPDDRPVG